MSVDSSPGGTDGSSEEIGCSLCTQQVGTDGRFVTCYPADTAPSPAADDGLLGLCDDCAGEVEELVDAWTDHEAPPVGADWTIGAGYRRVTDNCSFCTRRLGDGPVLGVEDYQHDDAYGDADAGSNYSLCDGCRPVFAEFLDRVGVENTD